MNKIKITKEEFEKIVNDNGGFDNLQIFGVHTAIEGDQFTPNGEIYTEWGLKGAKNPLVLCVERGFYPIKENGTHEHFRFED